MTCFERYKQKHGCDPCVLTQCPHLSGGIEIEQPDYCPNINGAEECNRCWDRQVPGLKRIYIDEFVPKIKDSGERRAFSTGAVRDIQEGKGRMDLLPWAAVMEISKHCEAGALKYGEHNVDKGIPTHSLCDSAARHLAKYLDGWTDEPHLLAAAWNLLWAVQMELKNPEMVDTPWKHDTKEE